MVFFRGEALRREHEDERLLKDDNEITACVMKIDGLIGECSDNNDGSDAGGEGSGVMKSVGGDDDGGRGTTPKVIRTCALITS